MHFQRDLLLTWLMPCEAGAVSAHILSTPYNYAPVYGATSFETFRSWVHWAVPAALPSRHHPCSILARSSQFLPLTCNAGHLGFSQGTLAFPFPPLPFQANTLFTSTLPPPPSPFLLLRQRLVHLYFPFFFYSCNIISEGWLSAGRKHFCQAM